MKISDITKTKSAVAPVLPVSANRLLLSGLLLGAQPALADNLWDLPLEDLVNVRITSIASATDTTIDKAAAITTAITAKDIATIAAPKYYIRGNDDPSGVVGARGSSLPIWTSPTVTPVSGQDSKGVTTPTTPTVDRTRAASTNEQIIAMVITR